MMDWREVAARWVGGQVGSFSVGPFSVGPLFSVASLLLPHVHILAGWPDFFFLARLQSLKLEVMRIITRLLTRLIVLSSQRNSYFHSAAACCGSHATSRNKGVEDGV